MIAQCSSPHIVYNLPRYVILTMCNPPPPRNSLVRTKTNHKQCLFDSGPSQTIRSCSLTHLQLRYGFHQGPVRAVAAVGLVQQAVQHLPDRLALVHHHGLGALIRHVDPDHQLRGREEKRRMPVDWVRQTGGLFYLHELWMYLYESRYTDGFYNNFRLPTQYLGTQKYIF